MIEKPMKNMSKTESQSNNREQAYYDKLKLLSNDELISRGKELVCSISNKGIELDMIYNLLINRNEDVNEVKKLEFEYHRFVKNNDDENEKYGF